MENIKWTYFQYRKTHQYQVYIRLKQTDLNPRYAHLFGELGFSELSELEVKKIQIQKSLTKILTIQNASARLMLQINSSDILDQYGQESLSLQNGTPVYTFRRVGMMGVPAYKSLWDLALQDDISQTEQMVGFRILLTRFLSLALADKGVLTYWGTVKEGALVIMKQSQSFGEAILIDMEKGVIFSNGGEMKLSSSLKIIRKDKEMSVSRVMSREELISFLSVSTCLLSFQGITNAMKRSIFELSAKCSASYAISDLPLNL